MPRDKNEFAYFVKDHNKLNVTFSEFLHLVRDPDRKYNYYFAEESLPKGLQQDVEVPWLG